VCPNPKVWQTGRCCDRDPILAYRKAGYRNTVAQQRPQTKGSGGGIV
jgi:L-rhamnose isomerase